MISIARETLVFRRGGISPPLSLLIPTFAFPDAPARVVPHLQSGWNAPLPIHKKWIPWLRYQASYPIIIHAQSLDQ